MQVGLYFIELKKIIKTNNTKYNIGKYLLLKTDGNLVTSR